MKWIMTKGGYRYVTESLYNTAEKQVHHSMYKQKIVVHRFTERLQKISDEHTEMHDCLKDMNS